MSDYLVTQLAVGDTIKLTGALGHMVDHHQAGNYLLMSIGSGLSPIYSLYNHLIDTSHFDRLVNIFGERYRDNVIDEVEQSFSLQSDRVKNLCYLSKEKNLTKHRRLGYIQDGIHEAIEFLGINENLHVFLCGKPEMVNDVIHILISAGLDKSQIAFEKY
jgi:ferredoxin-NADP reductase